MIPMYFLFLSIACKFADENGFDLPAEAFLPDLPYVDTNYFAKPNSAQAKRIMNSPSWGCCNQEQPQPAIYDELSFVLF